MERGNAGGPVRDFLGLGLGLALIVWGLYGASEFALLALNAELGVKKFSALLSETVFYYSLAGAAGFFLFAGIMLLLGRLRQSSWTLLVRWRHAAAIALVLAQINYFPYLGKAVPESNQALDYKMVFQNLPGAAFGLFTFAAVLFLAWVIKSRLKRPLRTGWLKPLYLTLVSIFALNLIFYPGYRPGRVMEETGRPRPAPPASAPNVLLITIDSLRADQLSCYGNKNIATANIDSLAGQGIVFQNAFSQSDWTFPSISSLLTSLRPDAVYPCKPYLTGREPDYNNRIQDGIDPGFFQESLPPLSLQFRTLPEILEQAGYNTAAVLTVPYLNSRFGMAQGFKTFYSSDEMISAFAPIRRLFLHQIPLPDLYELGGKVYLKLKANRLVAHGNSAAYLNSRALEFLQNNRQKKFFLWIHYLEPHYPYGDPWEAPPPDKPGYQGPLKSGFAGVFEVEAGKINLSAADIDYLKYLYQQDLLRLDEQLGLLFKYLKDHQLWENTLIVLTADHGEQFLEHGHLSHGYGFFGEETDVPLIIKPAGQNQPRSVTRAAGNIDLAPTIIDLAGMPVPEFMQGRSLRQSWQGNVDSSPGMAYGSCNLLGEPSYALRNEQYLLIYHQISGSAELYDLKNDPLNQNDLSGSLPETREAMTDLLQGIIRENLSTRAKIQMPRPGLELSPRDLEKLKVLGYVK